MADDKPRSRSQSPKRPSMRDAPTGPRDDHPRRNRSRSPRRERRGGGGGGGFKWKEKRRDDDRDREGGERRLERGYRNRSPRRERRDDRDDRDGGDRGDRKEGEKDRARRERREKIVEPNIARKEDSLEMDSKFGKSSTTKSTSKPSTSNSAPAPAPAQQQSSAPQERMITVFVNDRLGTRAQIPCLASDNIKLFKMQVAAQIGRQPHEILLKRQGERPFKDMLTLEDYGVSNGVQLDLEIDTGE